ncbi:MAG: NADH-quinone oxidoreductase subunit NuoN [Actinomycetota bacterium]|nr:NADH-quinone oxidoreductase subunit NuoN [Actinomycetota bacterium]
MNPLLLADVAKINAPSVSYHALSPILIVLGAAMLGVLAEAVIPRAERYAAQMVIALAGLAAAMVCIALLHRTAETTVKGAIAIDGTGLFLQGTIVLLAIMSVLLVGERTVDATSPIVASAAVVVGSPADQRLARTTRIQTEIFPLLMFAVSGMLIFPVSNNLLLMFIALEVMSLPLYLMAGLARRRRLLSQEAAMKYFLLGAFASAFFLYGLALLYGYANSVDLPAILRASQGTVIAGVAPKSDVLLYVGLALLLVGLLFKAGIAPFHSWTPDVYQGAPTAVTAFMASCTKVAAFGAILRVLYVGFNATAWDWRPIVWAVAIASMAVGAVFGLTQTDLKRILAYSSIAHAGFILVGVVALTKDGISSVLFYLLTYGFTTLAAFGLLTLVRDADGEAAHLSQWSGLARKSPVVATLMTVLLMSMAGIPLTAGFIAKFYVFRAAYHVAAPLVVLALVFSAIAAFYYLRIVVLMFFAEPPENGPTVAIPGWSSTVALTFGAVVAVVLGIVPQPVLDLASKASKLVG